MRFTRLPFYVPLLMCASAAYAQVTLNPLPTREIGHPRPDLSDHDCAPRRRPRWQRYEEWELHREIADAFIPPD